ncbi:MAG TPA: ABC transporter permease [Terriglobales bacterium]|nr:ABC transporter permease [Terriglobales bacterium]
METLLQDARYGIRTLRNHPAFAAVAILTIAVGIGTSATIFSWIRSVLLNPLPGAGDPDHVVALEMLTPSREWTPTSYLDFQDFRDHARSVSALTVTYPMDFAVGGRAQVERIWGELVSGNYFDMLRVRPEVGRFFSRAESGDEQNAHDVVVISDSLWKNRYGSDPSVVGTTVQINRYPYTIIGVAPASFHGSMPGLSFEMWAPATTFGQLSSTGDWMLKNRKTRMFRVLARLAPPAGIEQARAELEGIARQMAEADADTNQGMSVTLLPLWRSHYGIQESLLAPLSILMGACGVVLLIVCANVANLLLARAVARRRELSVRLALGARRSRLIRQLLTESLLIAVAGALVGLCLCQWLGGSLRWLVPATTVPNLVRAPLDAGVLLFMAGLAFAVASIAGLAPAIHASRSEVNETLKEGGRSGSASAHSHRMRGLLVTSEVALAMVALIGAGLFIRSFHLAREIRPGFDSRHIAIAEMNVSAAGYDATRADSFRMRLEQSLEHQPGVTAVAYGDYIPLSVWAGSWEDLEIQGYVPGPNENMKIYRNLISPGYFDLMKIPVLEGRDFTLQDDTTRQPVMIVTQAFVRRFLANRNPIGQKVHGWGRWFSVIGVVQDSKIDRLTESPRPYFYVPIRQIYRPEMGLKFFVRSSAPADDAVAALRRASQAIDSAVPVYGAMSLEEYIAASLFPQKIAASLLATLSSIALLLAAIGLYGVMAYSVARRTSEIGIRIALGARPRDVLRMILREGMWLTLPGLALGWLLAMAMARLISAFLVQISPNDPSVYVAAAAGTVLFALGAAANPARRAAKVDPMAALRYE